MRGSMPCLRIYDYHAGQLGLWLDISPCRICNSPFLGLEILGSIYSWHVHHWYYISRIWMELCCARPHVNSCSGEHVENVVMCLSEPFTFSADHRWPSMAVSSSKEPSADHSPISSMDREKMSFKRRGKTKEEAGGNIGRRRAVPKSLKFCPRDIDMGSDWAWTSLADSNISLIPPFFTKDGRRVLDIIWFRRDL